MANERARDLRRNMTDAERKLWSKLRHKQIEGFRFRRQVPIGRYIADFACYEARVIVEVDGSQHADNAKDKVRTAWLEREGFSVLRFWNNEVLDNIEGVLHYVRAALIDAAPGSPDPPP